MQTELFTCTRDNLTIRGKQFYPSDFNSDKQYPVIIFCHGFTGNYSDMEPFCADFAKHGYFSLCFSFCGGGRFSQPEYTKSDGSSLDMSIQTEVADLLAVVSYVKELPFVDRNNIILAGASQGGFVAGMTAAVLKDEISKLVMIFPAICIPDHARMGCLGGASYDTNNVPEQIVIDSRTVLGRQMHEEMAALDPYLALSAYKGPVLILHGNEDKVVNYSYSVKARETYQKGQCHLQIIRNMGHFYNEHQYESVIASIRQFLDHRKEVLSIRVVLTHTEHSFEANIKKSKLYFTGYCETPYFQGAILPEGCDCQEHMDDKLLSIHAEYTLDGLDAKGEHCHIHIVNQPGEIDWAPRIQTDSASLSWMNRADLTAVLEYGDGGPTVRIFAKPEDIA